MKKLIIAFFLISTFSCKRENIEYQLKSPFPTSIQMGSDATYFRVDSVCLCDYSAYLNTCGTAPDTEAPSMGTEIYQISGPTTARISWKVINYISRPQVTNLSIGIYNFVGHAYVIGYRSCDGQTMNNNAYDTIKITITRNKKHN